MHYGFGIGKADLAAVAFGEEFFAVAEGLELDVGVELEGGGITRGGGHEAALEFVVEGVGEYFCGEAGEARVLTIASPEEAAHATLGCDGFGEVATGKCGEEAEGAIDVGFADAVGSAKDGDLAEAETEIAQGAVAGKAEGV